MMIGNRGHFIVVEGLEGAGKSSAIQTIKRFLTGKIDELVCTREPGGTRIGDVIRTLLKEPIADEALDPRAELLLFYASRVQLLEYVIRPALQRGSWVLADRFELSTMAYQGGGRGLDEAMIKQLSSFCVHDLKPDLVLFLDINPEKGLRRASKRGPLDRIEQEGLSFLNTVNDSYHRYIKHMDNVVIIDANQPLSVVQQSICAALENYRLHHVHSVLS